MFHVERVCRARIDPRFCGLFHVEHGRISTEPLESDRRTAMQGPKGNRFPFKVFRGSSKRLFPGFHSLYRVLHRRNHLPCGPARNSLDGSWLQFWRL